MCVCVCVCVYSGYIYIVLCMGTCLFVKSKIKNNVKIDYFYNILRFNKKIFGKTRKNNLKLHYSAL